jgi:hypothetical protein
MRRDIYALKWFPKCNNKENRKICEQVVKYVRYTYTIIGVLIGEELMIIRTVSRCGGTERFWIEINMTTITFAC